MIKREDLELIISHCEGCLKIPIEEIDICPLSTSQDKYNNFCMYVTDNEGMLFKGVKEELMFYKCNYLEKDYKKYIGECKQI